MHPNNPTGAVYSRATLEGIARFAEQHRLVVLADEIYDQMTYDGAEFVPMVWGGSFDVAKVIAEGKVGIFKAVEDFLAIAAGTDQAHLPQPAHVVRNGRLADARQAGKRADILFSIEKRIQDADPAGIAKSAEQLCHMSGSMLIHFGKCHPGLRQTPEYMFMCSYYTTIFLHFQHTIFARLLNDFSG